MSGTFLTTGNKTAIDTVGTVTDGVWQGTAVADTYVADDLTISGGTVNGTVIGAVTPAAGGFTSVSASGAVSGGSITDGTATFTNGALSGATAVTASGLVTAGSLDIDNVQIDGTTIGHTDDTDLMTLSNGTVTVAGTVAAVSYTHLTLPTILLV